MKQYINDNWGFTEEFNEDLIQKIGGSFQMQKVRLPHTCKETPFHYFDEHIYKKVQSASMAYPERSYASDLNNKIIAERKHITDVLLSKGFTGEYPRFYKDKRSDRLARPFIFMRRNYRREYSQAELRVSRGASQPLRPS